jgi:hypothetical protein
MLRFLGIPLVIVLTEVLVLSLWPTPDSVSRARSTQAAAANLDNKSCVRCSATGGFH